MFDQRSYSTVAPVSTMMGDHRQMGKPLQYVTGHPGQLSLAIPSCIGLMGINEIWGVNTLTLRDALALYLWFCSVNWCLAEG